MVHASVDVIRDGHPDALVELLHVPRVARLVVCRDAHRRSRPRTARAGAARAPCPNLKLILLLYN